MQRNGDFVGRMLGSVCNCGTVRGRGSQTSGTRKEEKANPNAEQACGVSLIKRAGRWLQKCLLTVETILVLPA